MIYTHFEFSPLLAHKGNDGNTHTHGVKIFILYSHCRLCWNSHGPGNQNGYWL